MPGEAWGDVGPHYARRIKADTRTMNCIEYGKLKIVAKLGQLLVRDTPRGRGKKSPKGDLGLSDPTVAAYRKVGDHADKIDGYHEAALEDEEAEMSMSGFVRYIASDPCASTSSGSALQP